MFLHGSWKAMDDFCCGNSGCSKPLYNTQQWSRTTHTCVSTRILLKSKFSVTLDTGDLEDVLESRVESKSKKNKKSGKHQKKDSAGQSESGKALSAIGGKDTSLFLFRAIGKILYCKREPRRASDAVLPSHLSHHERDRLIINPEVRWTGFEGYGSNFLSGANTTMYMKFILPLLKNSGYLRNPWLFECKSRLLKVWAIVRGYCSHLPGWHVLLSTMEKWMQMKQIWVYVPEEIYL